MKKSNINYILNNNKKATKLKKIDEFKGKNYDEKALVLVNIGTELKGPVYTITSLSELISSINIVNTHYDFLDIKMSISYRSIDVPLLQDMHIHFDIFPVKIEKFIGIDPLLQELSAFNIFKEKFLFMDNEINMEDISIYNHYLTDKNLINIQNFPKVLSNKILKKSNSVILIFNNIWKINDISKIKNENFDYIGILVNNTNSIYVLTNKEYKLFKSIINITIYFDSNYFDIEDEFLNTVLDRQYMNSIEATNIYDILDMFLYIPQLLLLEKIVYSNSSNIIIDIVTDSNQDYTIKITDKEASEGICLFDIIKRLLKK